MIYTFQVHCLLAKTTVTFTHLNYEQFVLIMAFLLAQTAALHCFIYLLWASKVPLMTGIWKEGCLPLFYYDLFRVEALSRLGWFWYLIRMHPGHLPLEVFPSMSNWEETQTLLEGQRYLLLLNNIRMFYTQTLFFKRYFRTIKCSLIDQKGLLKNKQHIKRNKYIFKYSLCVFFIAFFKFIFLIKKISIFTIKKSLKKWFRKI